MATSFSEGLYAGDVLKWESDARYCRQSATIKQDAAAVAGLGVGQILENNAGKKVVCTTGASADSVLLEPVLLADLIAGDTTRVILVRGPAVIDSDQVTIDAAQKTAALAALLALLIVSRTGPTYTT